MTLAAIPIMRELLGVAEKNSSRKPVDCKSIKEVDDACKVVNCEPSPFQAITENYRKAHIRIEGLPITIENPKGSMRRKLRPDGSVIWECEMPAHYGYIKNTVGSDFDQVDCFIGHHDGSKFIYIIDQCHPDSGKYDESKCMIWFKTPKKAKKCYMKSFSDGSGKKRFLGISGLDIDSFKEWLKSNATLQAMTTDFDQAIPDQGKRGGAVYPRPRRAKIAALLREILCAEDNEDKDKKKEEHEDHEGDMASCEERSPRPCAGYPRKQ